jgi:hypothetical protein
VADLNYAGVHQTAGRTSELARFDGQFGDVAPEDIISAVNGYSTASDLWTPSGISAFTQVTFQAPNASSATTYSLSGSTAAALAEGLGDLGTALGRAVTEWYTVDQTTAACTAKNPGITGTFTATTGITWTNTTVGSSGTDLPVGRFVLSTGLGSAAGMNGVHKCRLPAASTTQNPTTKQIIVFTPTGTVGAGDQLRLVVRSRYLGRDSTTIEANYDANLTTTLAALATDANTILDLGIDAGGLGSGAGVVATSDATTFTLTADVKGYVFDADLHITNAASGTLTLSSKAYTGTIGNKVYDIVPNILGILGRGGQVRDNTSNAPVLPPLRQGEIARKGTVWIANTQAPGFMDRVWLDPATGKAYNAYSSGYIPLPADRASWTGNSQGGYAEIRINF